MRFASAAVILVALASFSAGAADLTLTESSAVDLAVNQNLTISAGRVELESKRLVSDTAWGVFVPSLSLSAGVVRTNAETTVPAPGIPYHWTASAGLGASISLSAAAVEGVRTARLDYQAGRITFEQALDEINLQVRTSFYRLILLERQLTVTEASIATAEQTLAQTQTDYANGRVQRLTVRQAELSVRSAKLVLERQTVERQNALASFKNLLGIPPEKSIELHGTIEITPIATSGLAASAAVEERNDIRAASAQIALQESKNRASYLSLVWPALTVSASFSPVFPDPLNLANPPGAGWNDRGSLSISLSASSLLAFLPFVPQNVGLKTGEQALQSLLLRKQELTATARTQIESLVRSLEASRAAIESLKESVSIAQESYDLTKEAYGLGTADFLTLKSAEDDLLQARYEVLSEEYAYLSTLLSLEQATGLDLRGAKE